MSFASNKCQCICLYFCFIIIYTQYTFARYICIFICVFEGDMMVAVNDVGVTWENLETICNKLSSKVVSTNYI